MTTRSEKKPDVLIEVGKSGENLVDAQLIWNSTEPKKYPIPFKEELHSHARIHWDSRIVAVGKIGDATHRPRVRNLYR